MKSSGSQNGIVKNSFNFEVPDNFVFNGVQIWTWIFFLVGGVCFLGFIRRVRVWSVVGTISSSRGHFSSPESSRIPSDISPRVSGLSNSSTLSTSLSLKSSLSVKTVSSARNFWLISFWPSELLSRVLIGSYFFGSPKLFSNRSKSESAALVKPDLNFRDLSQFVYNRHLSINPQTPVAQKIADEVVFRRFQGEGVDFF